MSDIDFVAIALLVLCGIVLALQALILKFPRRFSLRTLLIATTLVAAGLGLIVWAIR